MIAIIGGTGLTSESTFNLVKKRSCSTAFGEPSSELLFGEINKIPVVFISRHGFKHNIPPHKVNYRANIQALKDAAVTSIVAVNAVGGISEKMSPGTIVLPDQIIDYSYGREHTFFADDLQQVEHIDFTYPYSKNLVKKINQAAEQINLPIINTSTYACTQGPRLESIAEIKRLKQDGCDIVGMTGMPEAALAREAGIDYASISFVANWAAGISSSEITMQEIEAEIANGMDKIKTLIALSLPLIQY